MINEILLSIHENVKAFLPNRLTSLVRNLVHYIAVFPLVLLIVGQVSLVFLIFIVILNSHQSNY